MNLKEREVDLAKLPTFKDFGLKEGDFKIILDSKGESKVVRYNFGRRNKPPKFLTWDKSRGGFIGQIKSNNKQYYFGRCKDDPKEKQVLYNKCLEFYNKTRVVKTLKTFNNKGYLQVSIGTLNGKKKVRLHRLIAEAFIENPNNYPTVDHKDNDRSNNNINNLRWATTNQQALNRSKSKDCISKYIGVTKDKRLIKKPWYLCLEIRGKRVIEKYFHTEIEAAKARDQYIRDNLSKEDQSFVKFNFPEG